MSDKPDDSSSSPAGNDLGEITIGFTVAYVVLARALIERGSVEGEQLLVELRGAQGYLKGKEWFAAARLLNDLEANLKVDVDANRR